MLDALGPPLGLSLRDKIVDVGSVRRSIADNGFSSGAWRWCSYGAGNSTGASHQLDAIGRGKRGTADS